MPNKVENYKSFELIRYASKIGFTIIGGLDKLLKTMENEYNPSDIMTYADMAWGRKLFYFMLKFYFQKNVTFCKS